MTEPITVGLHSFGDTTVRADGQGIHLGLNLHKTEQPLDLVVAQEAISEFVRILLTAAATAAAFRRENGEQPEEAEAGVIRGLVLDVDGWQMATDVNGDLVLELHCSGTRLPFRFPRASLGRLRAQIAEAEARAAKGSPRQQ
jgi:hypothetical protein